MRYDHIQCDKINKKNIIESVDNVINYNGDFFGFKNLNNIDCKDVKICFIDSGCPSAFFDKSDSDKCVDFTNSNNGVIDTHGHSSAISGILRSYNRKIIGLCQNACYYYAKGISDDGFGKYNSVTASVLWSIVKKVDIIIMAFGGSFYDQSLHDAIKKAFSNNIAIFSAAGNGKDKYIKFPSNIPEVMTVGYSGKILENKDYEGYNKKYCISLPFKKLVSLHNDKYVSFSGSSMLSSVVGGISGLILQKQKNMKKIFSDPFELYNTVLREYN